MGLGISSNSKNKIHSVELPENISIGPALTSLANAYLTKLTAGKRVLLVRGLRSYESMIGTVFGLKTIELVVSRPPALDEALELAENISRTYRRAIKAIVSIGGGSVIDMGKVLGKQLEIPTVSIPTTLSHDGIASPRASLTSRAGPVSQESKVPRAVFVDLQVAASSPHRLIASGFGDTIAKRTAVLDWKLAAERGIEEYGDYSGALAELSASHVLSAVKEIASSQIFGLRVLAEALVNSGIAMAIAGSSRPASGSEHLFAHAVQIISPGKGLHGELCGLGTIMMSKLHGIDWEMIRDSLAEVGAPTKAMQLGLSPDEVIEALLLAPKIRDRYTILSQGLSRAEAEALARKTGVI